MFAFFEFSSNEDFSIIQRNDPRTQVPHVCTRPLSHPIVTAPQKHMYLLAQCCQFTLLDLTYPVLTHLREYMNWL